MYVYCRGFTHHGIDCGDGTVIVYRGKSNGGKIDRLSRVEFANGQEIFTKEYGRCDPPSVVVARAESRLGETDYCFFGNNCEHFAYWCKTGHHESEQVNRAATSIRTAIGVGMATVTKTVADKAAEKGLNPLMRGLVKLGLKKAPQAGRAIGGVAGVGSLVTGVAADLLVGHILKDGEDLVPEERQARTAGRAAGQIASIAGGVGGTIAITTLGATTAVVASAIAAPAVLGIAVGLGVHQLRKK